MLRQKRAVEIEGPESGGEPDGRRLMRAAGILTIVALLGPVVDAMWLTLLPAAALLAAGAAIIGRNAGRRGNRPLQFAAVAVSVSAAVLILLALTGMLVQQSTRIEPRWLTAIVTGGGWLFLASVIAFGLAGSVTRSLPRIAALSMALSLPLGIGIEASLGRLAGLVFGGIGTNAGLGLFGLSLLFVSAGRRLPKSETTSVSTAPPAHSTG